MGSPELAGDTERRIFLAIQEALWELTLLSETEDHRERQMVQAVMPVHELLLDGRENTGASELPRLVDGDADPNFLTEGQWRSWDVGEVGLKAIPQVRIVNDESRAVLEPDGVLQPTGTGSLVDHCLGATLAVVVEETGTKLKGTRAGGRGCGSILRGRREDRIKLVNAIFVFRQGGLCIILRDHCRTRGH